MSRNIIAILRGIKPNEVLKVSQVIANSGIYYIEVALNSPDAFESIRLLRNKFSDNIQIGAGTVTKIGEVLALSRLGVDFIVSPNFDHEVVNATKKAKRISYPGVTTASECYSAINCGADGLKFFPASLLGIENFKALKAILPKDIPFYMVGGIQPENFSSWLNAGATGFGIGSGIYKAEDSPESVSIKSKLIVQSYDQAQK